MEVTKRLIQARGNKSQRKVANDLGVSPSAISMYEQGNRVPKDSIKIKLAEYYGMTVQELFF